MPEEPRRSVQTMRSLLAGGVAGAVSKTVVAPLERAKLLLQLQHANAQIAPDLRYRGLLNCLYRLPREQGFWSLWRGNTFNILRYFPAHAIHFPAKDAYRALLLRAFAGDSSAAGHSQHSTKTTLHHAAINLIAGGAAGATALAVVYPLDFARTRMATDVGTGGEQTFRGVASMAQIVRSSEGIRGLYRGFSVALIGIVLYRAAYFGGFDTIKETFVKDPDNMSWGQTWVIAQGITTTASLIAYPLDTVRRRMMMQSGRTDILYKNPKDCFVKMWKNEGLGSLYRGVGTNILRGTGGAFVLVLYEQIQRFLRHRDLQRQNLKSKLSDGVNGLKGFWGGGSNSS